MRTRNKDASVEPDTQSAQRISRKRRASSSSEASVQPASQVSQSQTKKRKKTQKTTEASPAPQHPQLARLEEEEIVVDTQQENPRHVHFTDDSQQNGDKATAANITPHPRKITVHRRVTLSPADLRKGVKPSTHAKSRASMPASTDGTSETNGAGPEIDFVPLKDLIQERLRQRLEEKKQIMQLDGSDEVDTVDEDMMVYTGHQDGFHYPRLPAPPAAQIVHRVETSTEEHTLSTTQPQERNEFERAKFEDAIRRLTQEISEAKSANEILTIELQTLGFGGHETTSTSIVTSIRESFDNIREKLRSVLPGEVSDNTSSSQLINLIVDRVVSLNSQTAAQDQIISDKDGLQQELINEINGLVDKLTEAEIRKAKLEAANAEFENQNQEDDGYIKDMEQKLRDIEKSHDKVHSVLAQKEKQLKVLRDEHSDLNTSYDKLTQALGDYRTSEDKLQELITRMEETHVVTLAKAEDQHNKDVETLNRAIREESTKRKTAEADADDKQTFITDLETRYEESQTLVDELNAQLERLKKAEAAAHRSRKDAEDDRDNKATFINELENKIEAAEASLENLQDELEKLRELKDSERRQREEAEASLDESNDKIKNLDARLHKQGTEANELRSKLFELQQREQKIVKEMQDAAMERQMQYETDLNAESAAREDAEALAADRADSIADLQKQLRKVEKDMQKLLAERDSQVSDLTTKVENLQGDLDTVKDDLETAAVDYEELRTTSEARIAELEGKLRKTESNLTHNIEQVQLFMRQADTLGTEITKERTVHTKQLAVLTNERDELNALIDELTRDKTSLERRVESEAESMLELQANKDDEIADLKTTILDKQAEIRDLGIKAAKVDDAWNQLMREKDASIHELTQQTETVRTQTTTLRGQNKSLKDLFRKFVQDATETTDGLRAELEAVRNKAAERDQGLKAEGLRVLDLVDQMGEAEVEQVEQTTTTVENKAVRKVKKGKKGGRAFDSAIGVEAEENLAN